MNYPSTILHPDAFTKSQWHIVCPYCERVIGFDGIFDWRWVMQAIGYDKGKTRIMPMDFDGVIERHCHFLIFETKDVGKEISQAQQWTLKRLRKAKSICIMKVWGKRKLDSFEAEFSYMNKIPRKIDSGVGEEEAKNYVRRWFEWANNRAQ